MKICHLITRLILGGAQENTLLTCAGLSARGHDVLLITGNPVGSEGRDGELLDMARKGGYRVQIAPHLFRAINPWQDGRAYREIVNFLQDFRPDVVHTHTSKAGILGREAAHRLGVPAIVHTIHGMSFNRTQSAPVRAFFRFLERRAAKQSHALVGVCEAMVRQSLAAGVGTPEQYQVIYSGMETEKWWSAENAKLAPQNSKLITHNSKLLSIGTIARLFPNKGHDDLLLLLAELQRRGRLTGPFTPNRPQLRFIWIGDGPLRPHLERELARRGLAEHVELLGLMSREELLRRMGALDMLLHTSRWEGLPRVLVQALLAGVVPIAWDLDGNPEVCQDGVTGRCVPPGDIRALADAVEQLAGHPALRRKYADAGRAWCRPRFNVETMVEQLENLYRQLLT